MKHVAARPFITHMHTRLRETYARQPLHKPLILPLICGLCIAFLTFLFANGGGPFFAIGVLGVLACLIWTAIRAAARLAAFARDYRSPVTDC